MTAPPRLRRRELSWYVSHQGESICRGDTLTLFKPIIWTFFLIFFLPYFISLNMRLKRLEKSMLFALRHIRSNKLRCFACLFIYYSCLSIPSFQFLLLFFYCQNRILLTSSIKRKSLKLGEPIMTFYWNFLPAHGFFQEIAELPNHILIFFCGKIAFIKLTNCLRFDLVGWISSCMTRNYCFLLLIALRTHENARTCC